jgi:16S rRNA (uracil1498-N3)-methyltransferase
MRVKKKETVELVNGKNLLALASLESVEKKRASLLIQEVKTDISPRKKVILVQALPRLNHLEWILEKGTELNASAFWLFPSLNSEKKECSSEQLLRLRALTISAMKQCGRTDLPTIHLLPPLDRWEEVPKGTLLYGDTRKEAPYLKRESEEPIYFFVGPEKGFHPHELELLEKRFHAQGAKLHENTLRVETAPFVALALLS